ncbi:hypothetical protein BpHYR1_011287 [Brachionus plicatilis]|uniref:Uncharacterized protein n=1 Tax=Brachionus plicatilis TaxID=10195 RepID=A0A3M7QTB2_BRAPC|nr:hypothetical protein BpHYR1_011287 [Brachionus plicatilis]
MNENIVFLIFSKYELKRSSLVLWIMFHDRFLIVFIELDKILFKRFIIAELQMECFKPSDSFVV